MKAVAAELIEVWRERVAHVTREGPLAHQWSTTTTDQIAGTHKMREAPLPSPTSLNSWWNNVAEFRGKGAVEALQKIEKNVGRLIMMNAAATYTMQDKNALKFTTVHHITQGNFEYFAYAAMRRAVQEGRPVLMPSMNCHGPITPQGVQTLFTDIDVKVDADVEFAAVREVEGRCARAVEALFSTLFEMAWPEAQAELHWGFLRVKEIRLEEQWRFGYHIYTNVVLAPESCALLMMLLTEMFTSAFEEMVLTEEEYVRWQERREGRKFTFALDDVTSTGLRFPNSFKIVKKQFHGGFYEMNPTVPIEEYMRRWRTVMMVATASPADRWTHDFGPRLAQVEEELEKNPLVAGLQASGAVEVPEELGKAEKAVLDAVRTAWERYLRKSPMVSWRRKDRKDECAEDLVQIYGAVDWSTLYKTKSGRSSFIIKFRPRTPCVFCWQREWRSEGKPYRHESETNVNFLLVGLKDARHITVTVLCYAPSCRYITRENLAKGEGKKRKTFMDEMRVRLRPGERRHYSISVPTPPVDVASPLFGEFVLPPSEDRETKRKAGMALMLRYFEEDEELMRKLAAKRKK